MGVIASMMASDKSWNTASNPAVWDGGYAAVHTTAGETITPDGAMQLSAYYACIRNVAEDVGKLPLILYERLADRGKRRAVDMPLYSLMHRKPNPNQTSIAFREQVTGWAAGWGVGYAEIQRDGSGVPAALWPVHPSRVTPVMSEGALFFRILNNGRTAVAIPDANMIRIPGPSIFGEGKSAIAFRAESLGVAMAAQKFAASYYGNGMGISMALIHPGKLSPEAHTRMRESWASMHQGAGNAHKPFIGEEGMQVQKISIPANEAQFLETRVFQIEEICRWFRMPPHKIQHLQRAAGWSTLESANTDYLTDTLMPWMVRWEQELSRKLLFESEQDRYFYEFLFAGLLRGDQAARSAFYKSLYDMGSLNSNEIRELENLNPREGGDVYMTSANLMTDEQRAATAAKPTTDGSPSANPIADARAQADAYGVAVRAGAITPTPEDENAFRVKLGLPAMTADAMAAWKKDGNVHRPITITPPPGEGPAAPLPAAGDDTEAAERSARAMMPVIADAVARVFAKETRAVKHAATKHKADAGGFNKWADDFYETHATYLAEIVKPLAEAAVVLGGVNDAASISAASLAHVEDSRNAIDDAFAMGTIDAMCEQWMTTRTGSTVDKLSAILFPRGTQ